VEKPAHLRLRAFVGPRDLEKFPREDLALGQALFGMVRDSLKKGLPRPVMLVFRDDQVDRFELAEAMKQPKVKRDRLFGAMASMKGVECMALLGVLRLRVAGPAPAPHSAVAYVEWPDNRWWTAWVPLGRDGKPVKADPEVRTAEEGSPRPAGVGGWFSMARRAGLQLHLTSEDGPVH